MTRRQREELESRRQDYVLWQTKQPRQTARLDFDMLAPAPALGASLCCMRDTRRGKQERVNRRLALMRQKLVD